MLFVRTSNEGTTNELTKNIYSAKRKRDKWDGPNQENIVYGILLQLVCLAAFSAAVQIYDQTVMRWTTTIAENG